MSLEKFVIRRAQVEDLPQITRMQDAAKLTKSGPASGVKDKDLPRWLDPVQVIALVACPKDDLTRVVASAQLNSIVSPSRGCRARLEDVATHPEYEGNRLCRAILGRLFWWAQFVWGAGRIEWVSEDVEDRVKAREFYQAVVQAPICEGTNCNFMIRLPWDPVPEKMLSHFVDYRL